MFPLIGRYAKINKSKYYIQTASGHAPHLLPAMTGQAVSLCGRCCRNTGSCPEDRASRTVQTQFFRIRGKEMNKVILMGRLTRDPDIRYSQGENSQAIARYTLAVDRRFRRGKRADCRLYRLCCLRPPGGIRGEVSPSGNQDRHHRPDSDRKLHKTGRY